MIRQPSTFMQLYGWWRDALAGREVVRHDGLPECGYYRTQMVSGGPWVPVEIVCEREIDPETLELEGPERLVALVEGERRDPAPLWLSLHAISRADFESLRARIAADPRLQASRVRFDPSETPTLPPKRNRL